VIRNRPLRAVALTSLAALSLLGGCGVFATQKEHEGLTTKNEALEKTVVETKAELASLRADLDATRARLDAALRANADNGTDLMSEKTRINQMAGRLDENAHNVEELKKEVLSTRTEIDARLDEMKRAQDVQTPKPAPVAIPPDNRAHYGAIEAAYTQKDWTLTRTLGREFVSRYPTDDKADDVFFFMGDADLKDGRPSSALGEFNRVLKLTPQSNVLDKTLFGMGEAYLQMKDCPSAKLAFTSCASRFAKEKIGIESKARIATIDKPPPGLCGPQ
jgi:TolA-binding protein